MGRAVLNKSFIQLSVNGWGCVPSLLFDLRLNYGGGNEDNGDLLQKVLCMYCYTQFSQPCSRPLLETTVHYLPGKSGSVSCGVTGLPPGSWCSQVSICAFQESISHSCVSSGSSMVRLMATSSKKAYAIPKSAAP